MTGNTALAQESASIERLSPEHAAEYRALMLDAYRLHPDAFTSSFNERLALPLAWWQERLAVDAKVKEVVFGAFEAGELAGAAGLSFDQREKARHKAHFFGMYVHAESRGRHLGRALVIAALDFARARPGLRIVQLTVTQGNTPAMRLYESCGFVSFGVEPLAVAVGSDYLSKIHMWCDLGASGGRR